MKSLKQQAIELAWGVHYASDIDENGFRVYSEFHKFHLNQWTTDYWEKGFNEITKQYWVRPLSLKGIETNNGWIKIESEKDLPSEWDKVHFVLKGFEEHNYSGYYNNGLFWNLNEAYVKETVSHFQPIIKPEPPIF